MKMRKEKMSSAGRRRIVGGIAAVLVAGSVGFFGTVSAQANDVALKVLDNGTSSPGAEEAFKGLDATSTGQGGLDTSKLVKLGEDSAGSYWTGRDNSGNVCIIVLFDDAGISGSTCSPEANFAANGAYLAISGGDQRPDLYTEAYLVPDVVDLSTARISGLTLIGENLLVGDTRAVTESAVDIESTGTKDFTLRLAQTD